ncbi:MAG: alpha/beta fold hydrolase [Burkholderiaceae bacterium]|nr:alpha/beta fold hydrolase [Burkholderiaceae bacterium]
MPSALPDLPLPAGIRSRLVPGINGLTMHVLEAGHEQPGRPCVLLLHGFPELAYSWRKVMLPLAQAGYHVVAPDHRGYGRTTGWDARYDGDVASFRFFNLVRDTLGLIAALGHCSVAAVVGHDFGSPLAAWCALVRPDVFRSVALMSAPFGGPPGLPVTDPHTGAAIGTLGDLDGSPAITPAAMPVGPAPTAAQLDAQLASLEVPRKHYQWYYSTPAADTDMRHCPQGIHSFLRAYYHHKSADWLGNRPFELASWAPTELARMPTYYVMHRRADMAATVAEHMPSAAAVAACEWLPEDQLRVYSSEFARTGFQGGLQWYRCGTLGLQVAEQQMFAGRAIEVPATFIAGASDWGVYQKPGELQRMAGPLCRRFEGITMIDSAGHWVQQEQPDAVARHLLAFLERRRPA